MSKIGEFNLAMTEKVNELGYDTVEEAIADGWDSNEFYMSYMKEAKDELEEAHKAWLEEKRKVLSDLAYTWTYLHNNNLTKDADAVERAINFIEKGEQ